MSALTDDALMAMAKNQLGHVTSAKNSLVPPEYIEELRKHAMLYEHDTNSGTGFGFVTCLEKGCDGKRVDLVARVSARDGGKRIGLGSKPVNKTLVRQALARSSSMSTSASSAAVKPEPQDAVLPRSKKRSSGVALLEQISAQVPSRVPSYKRPKPNAALLPPKSAAPTALSMAVSSLVKHEDTSEVREKLKAIQSQILHTVDLRAKLNRKATKTKGDKTRIAKYDKEIKDLERRKEELNATLPSVKPLSRSNSMAGVPVASGSNVRLQQVAPSVHLSPLVYNPFTAAPVASGSSVKAEDQALVPLPDYPMIPADLSEDEEYDEQGNWHGRGFDHFRGPVAKADDIAQFLMSAGNAENFDGNARLDEALKTLNLKNLVDPLPGMEVALMPHQVIGVAWMLAKEKSANSGGILADEMGLGKTVQMISVIATNRADDPLRKATLILAPVALLDQWQLEIDLKTNLGLKCLIYHGSNKPKKLEDIKKYDVVLTTFSTLALEWPDPEAEEKEKRKIKRKAKRGEADWIADDGGSNRQKRKKQQIAGPLFQIDFHRICIDEAQNIRNKKTRVSRAVTDLSAKYRWCLTGTPIINALADAYGLIRFLKVRPWYDWSEFNEKVAMHEKKQPDLATRRLQAIFATTLLRRKKDSMLDGKPLITLPVKNVNLRKLDFSAEERAIYAMVEAKTQNTFNRFLRAGTVLKNYSQVLVLLLRLRQLCSHPSLIQEDGVAFVGPDEAMDGPHDKHDELTRAARLVNQDFVERMKAKLKETVLERMAAEKESANATAEGEECPICYDTYTDPIVTACTHVFCRECIGNVLNGAARQDANEPNQYKADERPCPTCRGPVSEQKLFSRSAFEPTDAEIAAATGAPVKDEVDDEGDVAMDDVKGKGKARAAPGRTMPVRKARRATLVESDEERSDDEEDAYSSMDEFIVEEGEGDEDWEEKRDARREERRASRRAKGKAPMKVKNNVILSDDEDNEEERTVIFGARPSIPIPQETIALLPKFLPSTKMKAMMEDLRSWAESHPDEKTLIISQWTQCLSLVSDYLMEHNFVHVKYQGNMSRAQRDTAVRVFMSKDKAKIMLMSLKCGGVGLNLTRANRVISLDLGWSEAIESQAFDRVHRLGQQREVFVERLVVKDTVEDRVLALQERKKWLADGSLGEGNGKKVGRLSVKELANLFGLDHRGNVLNP
ncbi:hypothetical protein EUX98_g1602 [Antrodiella citrinella]|uniref:RING-type domain-containing protein n=1 Tax=Antrodiella citrinella TaxID=2447956 RepID=A0A4S4N118_9APHY|nr:hypothetical protein EUX98_g1602 [Antrodiella citrinella]